MDRLLQNNGGGRFINPGLRLLTSFSQSTRSLYFLGGGGMLEMVPPKKETLELFRSIYKVWTDKVQCSHVI